ncbi:MAG: DNA repair protein RadA [Acidimicrobiales bacterium]
MRSILTCTACNAQASKWVGRCAACGAWGSLVERDPSSGPARAPVALAGVDVDASACLPTGVAELDRVLGGGLVPGSITLLGGEPGIGKSTLVLQALSGLAASGLGCLLVCAEESAAQVKRRADRLGGAPEGLLALAATELPAIVEAIEAATPAVCVIDSIQAITDAEASSPAGSVTQVRECAHALARVAKGTGTAVVLVGHVTKDGSLAGPRTLEHLVDTVLTFEGDRHHALRMLAATKHRFGPTGELGLFEMTDEGLRSVDDPSGMLLGDRRRDSPGSVVVTAMEGRRPLVAEIQALVVPGQGSPRRATQGIDPARLAQILAVLEQKTDLVMSSSEVFVSAVGGIRVTEPAADLGIALAVATGAIGVHLPHRMVAFGEIGLVGELRQVPHAAQRLAEAARLGFRQAFVPQSSPPAPAGIELIRIESLAYAVDLLHRRYAQRGHPAARRPVLTPVG